MSEIASASQLRMSLVRWALITVPAIVVIGSLMGALSNSGFENGWYAALDKPSFQPPGWAFGVVWPVLYALIGIAFAMILNARGASLRRLAIAAFLSQLALNFAWSPTFFAAHQVTAAFVLLLAILALAIWTTILFSKIRPAAALLMVPYLAWLVFASALNFETDRLNPNAESLVVPAARTNISL
jgi:translocator protein